MPLSIADIISQAISIIESEVARLATKQEAGEFSKLDCDQLNDYLKVLVLIERDRRVESKEQSSSTKELTDEELDAELEKAYAAMSARRQGAK